MLILISILFILLPIFSRVYIGYVFFSGFTIYFYVFKNL